MIRYAIYLCPRPTDPLWQFGSALLGYDAATGEDVPAPVIHGLQHLDWRDCTKRARVYGFHATLKAPFRLATGHSSAGLVSALRDFAAHQRAFSLGELDISSFNREDGSGLIALVPVSVPPLLAALERQVVTGFDGFRAVLTDADIVGRNPDSLTVRQRHYLDLYGYPYVLEDFQLHMTLSDLVPTVIEVANAVRASMIGQIGPQSFVVDALVLFEQPAPGERFRIVSRLPFGG